MRKAGPMGEQWVTARHGRSGINCKTERSEVIHGQEQKFPSRMPVQKARSRPSCLKLRSNSVCARLQAMKLFRVAIQFFASDTSRPCI